MAAAADVWVALLRGINVGGHRKLPMAELRGLLDSLGYADIATYIQSGNAVFTTGADEPAIAAILDRFGFEVPVILRGADELASIATGHPFADAEPDEAKLHVMFLAEVPDSARALLDAAAFVPDEAALHDRELYVHYAAGAGRSKLTTDAVERALGTSVTARNWRTVAKLAEMVAAVG